MKRAATLIAVLWLALWIEPVAACQTQADERALLHNSVPDKAPENVIVAEVQLDEESQRQPYLIDMRAEIVRPIQGSTSNEILLQSLVASACDRPFENATRGILVGFLLKDCDDMDIVMPILARRVDNFSLPEDFDFESASASRILELINSVQARLGHKPLDPPECPS